MVNFIEAINILLERHGEVLKELAEHEAEGKLLKVSIQMERLRTPPEQKALLERHYRQTLEALEALDEGPFLMVYYASNVLPNTEKNVEQLSDNTRRLSEAFGRTIVLQTMDFSDVAALELSEIPKDHILRQALTVYKDYEGLEHFLKSISSVLKMFDELDSGEKLSTQQLQNITSPESFKLLLDSSIEAALQPLYDKQRQPSIEKAYMNMDEAAAHLNMAVQTLYGLTSKRAIPFIKRGKNNLFEKAALDEWLAKGKKKSLAQMADDASSKGNQKTKH